YDFNKEKLAERMKRLVSFYNSEVDRAFPLLAEEKGTAAQKAQKAKKFVYSNDTKIKWTSSLLQTLVKGSKASFDRESLTISTYRPFVKQWLYYDRIFNHRYKARLWPTPHHENRVIQIIGTGESNPYSCLMSDTIPDLHVLAG